VDILLELMVKEETPFSPSQIGNLFTFLARQLAKGKDKQVMRIPIKMRIWIQH
jgi:hypothetical protein